MSEELLPYYEQELVFLRRLSKEFAERHPKIAGRLQLTGEACEDPHVERLIEACAFLAARVHRKLDDDFPELTSNFLDLLYPHYLRPIPSLSVVKFDVERNAEQLTAGAYIPRHTPLQSRPVQGVPCKFVTCYPVNLAPVRLLKAKLETILSAAALAAFPQAAGVLTLELEIAGSQATFSRLKLPSWRFFINSEPTVAYPLYQLLLNQVTAVTVGIPGDDRPLSRLGPAAISPVGFAPEEGLLDYDARSPLAYRLLTEYFAFPEKFLFFDLNLPASLTASVPDAVRRIELKFMLAGLQEKEWTARLLKTVSADTFQLHCTPVVNLFKHVGEPIRVSHTKTEYPVVADSRRPSAYEIYSLDSVRQVRKGAEGDSVREIHPLHSLSHRRGVNRDGVFWHGTRRQVPGGGRSDLFLSLVNPNFDPAKVAVDTLSLDLTCTNGGLPAVLPFRNPEGDLFMEGGGIAPVIQFLRKPTGALRPDAGKGVQWRLISHLALNQISLVDGGVDALAELLTLYDFADSPFNRRQIDAITALTAKPAMSPMPGNPFPTFVRGLEIHLELNEDSFAGGAAFLFGSVLDRFFSMYVATNSFTQLVVWSSEQKKEIARWAPRSGGSILA